MADFPRVEPGESTFCREVSVIPSGMRKSSSLHTGGVAALNHRLIAVVPAGTQSHQIVPVFPRKNASQRSPAGAIALHLERRDESFQTLRSPDETVQWRFLYSCRPWSIQASDAIDPKRVRTVIAFIVHSPSRPATHYFPLSTDYYLAASARPRILPVLCTFHSQNDSLAASAPTVRARMPKMACSNRSG